MIAPERKDQIAKLLKRNKNVTVKELSTKFDVTMETIRADLETLCKENDYIIKVHGGAYYRETSDNIIPFKLREKVMVEEKKSIARKSAQMVRSGDIIMLDSSSTSDLICKSILDLKIPVIIVTNNGSIMELCKNAKWIKLVGIGGTFDRSVNSFNGFFALETLSKYHGDIAFLSPTAISKEFGLSDDNQNEAAIRECMANSSKTVVLAVDNTKFNQNKLSQVCKFDSINRVITNEEPSEDWTDFFKENQIQVFVSEQL
jgi:DeoR/GlpR family transcriptional regulator of sugar metabolism